MSFPSVSLDHHLKQQTNRRTGCPECYGKLNCGCPDCYVPEFKRGKKKRVSVDLESVIFLPRLEYSICTVTRVEEEKATLTNVTKATVCTQVCPLCHIIFIGSEFLNLPKEEPVQRRPGSIALKTRNRWSLPAIPVTIKEKEKEKTRRSREPIEARNVGPPKQVKYFIIFIIIIIIITKHYAGQVFLQEVQSRHLQCLLQVQE